MNFGNISITRARPYPPNFRRIAAKTIEPAIGASTCAFGSHKCTENIGSFTRNPSRAIVQNSCLLDINIGRDSSLFKNIDVELDIEKIEQKIMNIGRDAVIVYIIRYILACNRSGWYPHDIIINIVGTRDASNQI